MASNLLSVVDQQAELPLSRQPAKVDMPIETIRAKKTSGAAFTLACDTSGLEDKEICFACDLDAGYFSRMKKGEATLQGDKLHQFCQVVGNRIYPEWLAYQIGCTLVEIETETQRLLRLEREENNRLSAENSLLKNVLQGKAA